MYADHHNSNKYEFSIKTNYFLLWKAILNMPIANDPIDITKDPRELLMDQFNIINNTNLLYTDFVFSTPSVAEILTNEINTKVTITPILASGYYPKRDFYYNRLDLNALFDNNAVEVTFTEDDENLSDIIDQVNEKYGIYLRPEDYVDVPLPDYSSLSINPNPQITVSATPESLIYLGTGILTLGERVRPVDDYDYTRNILIVTDSDNPSVYENTVVLLDTQYNKASYFKLFRNTVDVTKFRVDKVIPLSTGNFYLGGLFEFEAAIGQDPLDEHICAGVIIDTNGMIVQASETPLFGTNSNKHYGLNRLIDSVYLADVENTITPENTIKLYRYDSLGQRDTGYEVTGIAYDPVMIRVANDGKVYTVSEQYNGPLVNDPGTNGNQIRIDRLNIDGTADIGFSTVYIRSTGLSDVAPVMDILPLNGGGAFIYLKPIHGVSTANDYPIVNDTPFVIGTDPLDASFNPVFRIDNSGILVTSFKTVLPDNAPNTVVINSSALEEDSDFLSYSSNKLIAVTNRVNPITGFEGLSTLCFNLNGQLTNIAPSSYVTDVRWESIIKFIKYENGSFILTGTGKKKLPTGGWGNTEYMVATYNQSGQLTGIVYQPVVPGNMNPEIYDVSMVEWKIT